MASGDYVGLEGRPVDVQVDVAKRSQPSFTIVGQPGKSTRESRDRVRAAIQNSGFRFPKGSVLVNLAPASREKVGGGFDLPIALAILIASGQIAPPRRPLGAFGELGLNGELRAVRGGLLIADAIKDQGLERVAAALANAAEVHLGGIDEVYACRNLREAVAAVSEKLDAWSEPAREFSEPEPSREDFADVRSQEATKRGLLVAAAGGHNVLLCGPPGAGKTMLAKRFVDVLPPLEADEAVEVLRVASVTSGRPLDGLPSQRPFRAPHHTISYAGLVGGGAKPAPGEVTRAHGGVLFLDEFPEFPRMSLEALREPLESGEITIGRSRGAVTYPARFVLVAAMNPCPCGFVGHPDRACRCSPRALERYSNRLSGPLLDRIDLHLRVPAVRPRELVCDDTPQGASSAELRVAIQKAREVQRARWGNGLNNEASLQQIVRKGQPLPSALNLLQRYATPLGLSARGVVRALRVARTVADLSARDEIRDADVLEALQYRPA